VAGGSRMGMGFSIGDGSPIGCAGCGISGGRGVGFSGIGIWGGGLLTALATFGTGTGAVFRLYKL